MPHVITPIPNLYDSVTRPIAQQVAKEAMAFCGLPDNMPLYMPGERGTTNQLTSQSDDQKLRYGQSNVMECEVEERVKSDRLFENPTRGPIHTPVLSDQQVGLHVRQVYIHTDLTFRFKYIAGSKNEAEEWQNRIAIRTSEAYRAFTHTVLYNLTLPDEVLALLANIHQRRETIAGSGFTFPEYFDFLQVRPFHTAGAIDGDHEKLEIQLGERQAELSGHFEAGEISEPQRESEGITYEVEYVYTLSYLKPVSWYVEYQHVVHQQWLDVHYLQMDERYSVDELDMSCADNAWLAFRRVMWETKPHLPIQDGGLLWPAFDEWYVPDSKIGWDLPLMSWLLQLSPQRPQQICNLEDLPEVAFTPAMLTYLKDNHERITSRTDTVAKLSIYSNNDLLDESLYTVDEDLNVRFVKGVNLTKIYHLRLSFRTHPDRVSKIALETLSKHPYATLELFQTVCPGLDVEYAQRAIQEVSEGVKYLDPGYIDWFLTTMAQRGVGSHGQPDRHLSQLKRYKNSIPEITLPVEGRKVSRYIDTPMRDPGQYSGRNRPDPTDVEEDACPPFEIDGVPYGADIEEATTTEASKMNPGNYPIRNLDRYFRSTQYLGIFTKRN